MAQADVINIKRGGERHPDNFLLTAVAMWQRARAEARLEWAKFNEEGVFCTRGAETRNPGAALDIVEQTEAQFPMLEPRTTLGARALLEVAIDIVATKKIDPEASFGEGPVLEILINIARALSSRDIPITS